MDDSQVQGASGFLAHLRLVELHVEHFARGTCFGFHEVHGAKVQRVRNVVIDVDSFFSGLDAFGAVCAHALKARRVHEKG